VRQAVTVDVGRLELVDSPLPEPGPSEAVIRVAAVGLCGSDVSFFQGQHPYSNFPRVQGHEFSGYVEALPPGYVGELTTGVLTAIEPIYACGRCFPCRRGRGNCCTELSILGIHRAGGLSELVVVPISSIHPVPYLTPELAALVEPTSIGLHAAIRSQATSGDRVVVIGAGPIGLLSGLALLDRGVEVMIVDRVGQRLQTAAFLGASATLDSSAFDVHDAVMEWTDGDGASAVIEATGVPEVVRQTIDLVAASGTIVVVGVSRREVSIPLVELTRKELTIVGSRNNLGVFGEAADLVHRNQAQLAELITDRFSLAQTAEAIQAATTPEPTTLKVMVTDFGDRPPAS
jgi:L-gulonate 5-dehydrogenase